MADKAENKENVKTYAVLYQTKDCDAEEARVYNAMIEAGWSSHDATVASSDAFWGCMARGGDSGNTTEV